MAKGSLALWAALSDHPGAHKFSQQDLSFLPEDVAHFKAGGRANGLWIARRAGPLWPAVTTRW